MESTITMFTECVICKKPLGAESRTEGFMFCHEHRRCTSCNLDLTPMEAQWCYDKYNAEYPENSKEKIDFTKTPVYHARCYTLLHGATVKLLETEFQYLNLLRLTFEPRMDLDNLSNEKDAEIHNARLIARMSYEQQQTYLSRIQATIAQVQIALKLNPQKKKKDADEREKERFTRARAESLTSSRPANKSPEDSEEVQLGVFMEAHGLPERKIALEYMKRRNKEVKTMVKAGIPEKMAIEMADGMMIKGGFYNK